MAESLREQQKRVARERMLEATAAEIVENGPVNLSLLAVAERAGVSERTLYNYFKTRENLLAELSEYSSALTEAHGGRSMDRDPDSLPETLRTNWASWQAQGNVVKALLMLQSAAAASDDRFIDAEGRKKRNAAFRAGIAGIRPDLHDDQLDAIAALVQTISSSRSWLRMTDELQIPTETAATLAAWTYEVVRDALRENRSPFDQ